MTKDLHGCGIRRAGHNLVTWKEPVITEMPTPEGSKAPMKDDDLRRRVAAELSWDPQVDSEAIEVSAAGCGGRLVCARVTQVNDRIRIESRPELTVSPAARVSPRCSGSCGRARSGC